ncbi:hypothetical protein CA13_38960 [Planctomycetes bacterium CA13]|uniref:DUF6268 domain-containing protein n=1 Tax=Novipirellula herctigrandis TaxID=2527986 RepID=A0A5C5Z7C0_9BACT|nr:hypothetical protein CA13_38960 [Planctomycetes bacterium CA13]
MQTPPDYQRHLFVLTAVLTIVSGVFAQDYNPAVINSPVVINDSIQQRVSGNTERAYGEIPIERYRKSFYQGAEVLGGYLGGLGDKAGGIDTTFEEARVAFGVPLGSMDNILALRPYFRADHLRGPTVIDAPESLYNTGVSLFNQKKWSERFSSTLMLTPSIRSDFTTSKNAFRLFGLGLVNWQKRPDLSLSLGVVYLGRSDLPLLPAFGATWTPTPWWKFDAMLPRPRISRRLWKNGGESEGWAYFGGTIGGNTWAVTRDSGADDELTLSDLRLLFGLEEIRQGNRGGFFEAGYAFNRSIEYEQTEEDIDLDDALFVQAGLKF